MTTEGSSSIHIHMCLCNVYTVNRAHNTHHHYTVRYGVCVYAEWTCTVQDIKTDSIYHRWVNRYYLLAVKLIIHPSIEWANPVLQNPAVQLQMFDIYSKLIAWFIFYNQSIRIINTVLAVLVFEFINVARSKWIIQSI